MSNPKKAAALAALTMTTTVTSFLITTGVVNIPIPIAGIETRVQAQSTNVNINLDGNDLRNFLNSLVNIARNFWSHYYGARFLQKYFAHYEPWQVENIKKQYGSSANSFFHNQCKEAFYRASGASWWQKSIINPFGWFFFVHREEGGRVNCYVRVPQ